MSTQVRSLVRAAHMSAVAEASCSFRAPPELQPVWWGPTAFRIGTMQVCEQALKVAQDGWVGAAGFGCEGKFPNVFCFIVVCMLGLGSMILSNCWKAAFCVLVHKMLK